MDEFSTSTDVSGETSSLADAPVSTESGAASSSSTEGTAASPLTAGSVTAGTDAPAAAESTTTSATLEGGTDADDSTDVPDYLKDVPTLDELRADKTQKYGQALANLREAHESLLPKHRELESKFQPWQAVAEKYSSPEQVETFADLTRSLFTPVTDEQGQVKLDPETQLPQTSARAFLEGIRAQSGETYQQLLVDALASDWSGDTVFRQAIRASGLDPDKLEQYQAWEANGGAPAAALDAPSNEEVTPEELAEIPQEFHDAYKSLSPEEREDLLVMSPQLQQRTLRNAQRDLETERAQAADKTARETEQARQAEEFQTNLQNSQEEYVGTVRQEVYDSLKQNLASQWKPSSDAAVNEVQYGMVMSVLANAIDPALRSLSVAPLLEAAGITPAALDDAVNSVQTKAQEVKRLEAYKESARALVARDQLQTARRQVSALLSKLQRSVTKTLDERNHSIRAAEGEQLAGALGRPVPSSGQAGVVTGKGSQIKVSNPTNPSESDWLAMAGKK